MSTLFLVGKKDGGNRPVITFKKLIKLIPYQHFKMESLHYLRYMLQQGEYMCKLDIKYANFSVPLHRNSRDKVRFQWSAKLYELLCLCFGLGPAPRIFTKTSKVLISLTMRLNIKIVIYLDDILLLGRSINDVLIETDIVIFLLQHLGFVINLKKSILTPQQKIEFLGLLVDSLNMSLSLTPEKLMKVTSQCLEMYKTEKVSILQLTKLLGFLSSTAQAVLPVQLQFRYLQQIQVELLSRDPSYQHQVTLNSSAKEELLWWAPSVKLCNGRCLVQPQAEMVIQMDASKIGWGASCQGLTTRGVWSKQERSLYINVLELLAVKLALLSFTKNKKVKAIHF